MRLADSRSQIPSLAMLKAFDAFARLGSIRKAAAELGTDHASVSRHLRALELAVGVPLILRNNQERWLSPCGAEYFEQVSAGLSQIAEATFKLKGGSQQQLMIWSVPGFAEQWLSRRLADFHNANRDIEIEVRPSDREPNFLAGEADAYIGHAIPPLSPTAAGTRSQIVASPLVHAVASPAYLADRPPIVMPEDFLQHDLLHEETKSKWEEWLRTQGYDDACEIPGHRFWHANVVLNAAREGQGIGILNQLLLDAALKDGSLVVIESEHIRSRSIGVYLFTTRFDRWSHAPLARFRQWIASNASRG